MAQGEARGQGVPVGRAVTRPARPAQVRAGTAWSRAFRGCPAARSLGAVTAVTAVTVASGKKEGLAWAAVGDGPRPVRLRWW